MPGTPWLSPRALAGWRREIGNAYPGFSSKYTVINYEQFQQPNRGSLVWGLVESGVDFVVLDEVQLVKQRDRNASIRREAGEGLLSGLSEKNPNLYVFAMSATPVINNLLEARKLLEIIKGRSYRELEDAPTVNNALAVHRALMVECFRYRPAYEMDERVIEVDGDHLLDALMASRGVLSMEQMFLTAKLEAIELCLRDEGEDWSWDRGLWNTIHFKRTLSDCALEGRILEAVRISETELLRQSKETLEEWIKRVGARDL